MTARLTVALLALAFAPAAFAGPSDETIDPAAVDKAFAERFGAPGDERCDDRTFLRRLSLDIRGRLPTFEESQAFVADKGSDKRRRAIAEALASDDAARFLGRRLARRLLLPDINAIARSIFESYARQAVKENRSALRLAREMIAFEGQVRRATPEGIFLLQYQGQSADVATAVVRQFVGVSLDCARCHDHPFAAWKQAQFHELTAVFARTRVQRVEPQVFELYESPVGDYNFKLHEAKKGRSFKPRALDGADLSASPKRRKAFVDWLADPKRRVLARAQANRVFAELFGVPLSGSVTDTAHPDDDPALLTLLAEALVALDYDLRALRSLLMQTRAYQRRDELAAVKARPDDLSVPRLRRPLAADQLAPAILVATGRDRPADGEPDFLHRRVVRSFTDEIQDLVESDESGQAFGTSVRQALRLVNGEAFNGLIRARDGLVLGELINSDNKVESIVTRLVLRALCREPTKRELRRWSGFIRAGKGQDRVERAEDVFWALIASTEFACQR